MKKKTALQIRRVGAFLFILYIIALVYFLFFAEEYGRAPSIGEYRYNLVPFKEVQRFFKYRETLGTFAVITNLVGNIVGFIPFGLILPIINRRIRNLILIGTLSFELSLVVEVTQLVLKVGIFDVDDLLLNTLGGIIGYTIFYVCNKLRRKYYG